MSSLQVKDLPEDLHDALRARARTEHSTISTEVVKILRAELARSDMRRWLDEVRRLPRHADVDVMAALDAARDEIEGR